MSVMTAPAATGRWGGVCRHPGRPGDGKPVCSDCPRRAAGSASGTADLKARAAQRRSGRAAAAIAAAAPAPLAVREPDTITSPDGRMTQAQVLEAIGPEHGALILDIAGEYLRRYSGWPSDAARDAATLWLAHAIARDDAGDLIWHATPRLILTSSERGSGKSTVLDLLAILAHSRFGRVSKVTAPAFARVMGQFQEPLFLDEAKLIFGTGQKSLDLQGMLLAGYSRRSSALSASGGGLNPPNTFGPVAFAGKDNLITGAGDALSDLLDRSIMIRMERPDRHYPEVAEQAEAEGSAVGEILTQWTQVARDDLRGAASDLSAEIAGTQLAPGDDGSGLRAAQIWRPLDAIARVAGKDWPERARKARAVLSGSPLAQVSEKSTTLAQVHSLAAQFGLQAEKGSLLLEGETDDDE